MNVTTAAAHIRRRCTDRPTRAVLLTALATPGVRVRITRDGVALYGPPGTRPVVAHFTHSDHRAHLNLRASLRRAGIAT